MYTSSGRKLDTKEGRELCEELELTWKYPKLGKVITLSPDCKGIFQDLKALKVISPAVSEDILLAEVVFAHNSKIRRETRLSPFQLVTGKQSKPPPIDDTGELTSFINPFFGCFKIILSTYRNRKNFKVLIIFLQF